MANSITFSDTSDVVRNLTVPTAGLILAFPGSIRRIQVSCDGGQQLKCYRRLSDFTNDTNVITLPATTGFFDGPHVGRNFYVRSAAATTTATVSIYYADGMTAS